MNTQTNGSGERAPATGAATWRWGRTLAIALVLAGLMTGCGSDSGDDAGTDGTSGTDGTDGTSGTDGTEGTSGTDGTDGTSGTDGTDGTEGAAHPFLFGADPSQTISTAPFPNDLYRESDGTLKVAPLQDDPQVSARGSATLLELMTQQIDQRTGFGVTSAVWLFMTEAPDMATVEGRVHLIALSGPEMGREVAVQLNWNPRINAIGIYPAWGDYLLPDTTYAVYVTDGIKTAAGETIIHHARFAAAVAETAPTDGSLSEVREAFAPLREWLANDPAAADLGKLIIGTVFTTEPVVEYGKKLFQAVDAFTLERPTLNYQWDTEAGDWVAAQNVSGEAIETYFGTPAAPFEYNPGIWEGSRSSAASLPNGEKPYDGGSLHNRIGQVINGGLVMPAFNLEVTDGAVKQAPLRFDDNGVPVPRSRTLVPFTLFLCDAHLADPSNLPVAIFNHGGGATRIDTIAFANANCEAGVATAAVDMVFHGGRRKVGYVDKDDLIAPVEVDVHNAFTGLSEGDEGYMPDFIGDPGSASASVAQLYGIDVGADPLIIEANELTISADTYGLVRYLAEGDWSDLLSGLSFDSTRMFHNSLSFGTSYTTPLIALTDSFTGIVGSVGTGNVLGINMAQAPVNSAQATGLLLALLGIKGMSNTEMQSGSQWSVTMSIHQWLHGRGDPLAYAPYVLRHRDGKRPAIVHTGNSWDETLHNPSQISYANALGLPTYTAGDEWTIDPDVVGSGALVASPLPEKGVSENATYGDDTTTAAILWRSEACHAQTITAICHEGFEHPYPPITPLATPIVKPSPLCGIHAQAIAFTQSLLDSGTATIIAPTGTCASVYGP